MNVAQIRTNRNLTRSKKRAQKNSRQTTLQTIQLKSQQPISDMLSADFKFTKDNIEKVSVEYLFDFLRFHTFKDLSSEQLLPLFIKLTNVPLKKGSVIEEFLDVVDSANINKLEEIANKYQLTNLDEIMKQAGLVLKVKPDYARIFKLYFSISDSSAIHLLRYLIFLKSDTQEDYDKGLDFIESMEPSERSKLVNNHKPANYLIL